MKKYFPAELLHQVAKVGTLVPVFLKFARPDAIQDYANQAFEILPPEIQDVFLRVYELDKNGDDQKKQKLSSLFPGISSVDLNAMYNRCLENFSQVLSGTIEDRIGSIPLVRKYRLTEALYFEIQNVAGFSAPTQNALLRAGFTMVKELDVYSDEELLKFPHISKSVLKEIELWKQFFKR